MTDTTATQSNTNSGDHHDALADTRPPLGSDSGLSDHVRTVKANGIEIAYETFGNKTDPAILLVMGLGTQMLAWRDEMCEAMADAGHYVIRYDNRDVGLSTHMGDKTVTHRDMLRVARRSQFGLSVDVPYAIADMAADAAGLLDAIGIERCHVTGVSMGGMIAQQLAIDNPAKVLSLTSVMSTTGEKAVGMPTLGVLRLKSKPGGTSFEEVLADELAMWRVIGTQATFDPDFFTKRITEAYHRAFDPQGLTRQTMAVLAAPSRAKGLRGLRIPTAVVHGTADPIVRVAGGLRTAWLIPGADLYLFGGHGHDLPYSAGDRLIDAIVANCARAEDARTPASVPA